MYRLPPFRLLVLAFVLISLAADVAQAFAIFAPSQRHSFSQLNLFDGMFEEPGPLGKGITVGKVQVALMTSDRGENSIFGALEDNARWIEGDEDEQSSLADLAHDVCLTLLRKRDSWTAAHSESQWFSGKDAGKAEVTYNEWANKEAAKFEKVCGLESGMYPNPKPTANLSLVPQEYIPDGKSSDGAATQVVVSLVVEIEGDSTE